MTGDTIIIPTNEFQTPITREWLDSFPEEVKDVKDYTVYRHISPSGKVYVGITKLSLHGRWGTDGCRYRRCKLFYRAIKKYGWDNFVHEVVLNDVSKSEAIYTEKYLIRWYKMHKMSYNTTDGGEGSKGFHLPENARERISKYMKRRKSRAVLQYSIDGEFINEYESAKEAARVLGYGHTSVSNCASGKKGNILFGYIFIYKDNIDSLPAILESYSNHWRKHQIVQYLNGSPINTFESIREAERVTGICRVCIKNNILGRTKRAGIYTWERVKAG